MCVDFQWGKIMKCKIQFYDLKDDVEELVYGENHEDADKSHDVYVDKILDSICDEIWNMGFVLTREEVTRLGNKLIERGKPKEVNNLEDAW